MTDLGKVGVMPKGEYVEGTSYEMLDLVYYDGSSYLALIDTTVRPIDDRINWMLIVQGTPTATTEVLGKVKPDGTTITISEDGTITGAKQVPDNVLVAVEVGEDDPDLPPLQAPQIDADRLGGELPEHYAKKTEVDAIVTQIGNLEDLSTDDKITLVNAINELFTTVGNTGKETDKLSKTLTNLNNIFTNSGFGNNILRATKWENIEKTGALPATFFTNWTNETEFPVTYGSGVIIPALDGSIKFILYAGSIGTATAKRNVWLGYMKFSDNTNYTLTWRKLISDEELPELVSNPNILINADFRNPINQRGKTEYTLSGNSVYCIDRWNCSNTFAIVKILEKGLKVSKQAGHTHAGICQYIELKPGEYTFTAKINEVNCPHLHMYMYDFDNNYGILDREIDTSAGIYNFNVNVTKTSKKVNIMVYLQEAEASTNDYYFVVEWMKLEVGSIPTQFTPPNQAEELEKCRYYYQEFAGTYLFNSGGKTSGKYVSHMLYCNKMRTLPTASYKGTLNNTGSIYVADTLRGNKSREIQTLELKAVQFGNQYRIGAIVTPTDVSTLATYGSSSNEQIVFTGSARVVLDAEIY